MALTRLERSRLSEGYRHRLSQAWAVFVWFVQNQGQVARALLEHAVDIDAWLARFVQWSFDSHYNIWVGCHAIFAA